MLRNRNMGGAKRRLRETAVDGLLRLRAEDGAAFAAVLAVVRLLADKPDKSRR